MGCVRIDRYSHQRQVESPALHYTSAKFMTSLELALVVEWSQGDINHLSSNSRLSATDYDAHYFRICFMAREFLAISSYSPLFDMTHNDACSNIDVHVHAHIFICASCQSLHFAVEPKRTEQISRFCQKCDAFNKKALCLHKKSNAMSSRSTNTHLWSRHVGVVDVIACTANWIYTVICALLIHPAIFSFTSFRVLNPPTLELPDSNVCAPTTPSQYISVVTQHLQIDMCV